ncbi:hypothetical protein GCK32_010214, partial [Trichostrongylus colubriformis]
MKALIDTGSVISIIPVGLLKLAQELGVDMDSMVTMLGEAEENQVLDASGNPMKFLMRIAVDIKVKGAKQAKVHLHIQQSSDTSILIGTNAMEALGIEVTLKPETDTNQETQQSTFKKTVKVRSATWLDELREDKDWSPVIEAVEKDVEVE